MPKPPRPLKPRAHALELLAESERLEKELWSLTERLMIFTADLQSQVIAKAAAEGGENRGAAAED
jgi:hypothetical protein